MIHPEQRYPLHVIQSEMEDQRVRNRSAIVAGWALIVIVLIGLVGACFI